VSCSLLLLAALLHRQVASILRIIGTTSPNAVLPRIKTKRHYPCNLWKKKERIEEKVKNTKRMSQEKKN